MIGFEVKDNKSCELKFKQGGDFSGKGQESVFIFKGGQFPDTNFHRLPNGFALMFTGRKVSKVFLN